VGVLAAAVEEAFEGVGEDVVEMKIALRTRDCEAKKVSIDHGW